MSEALKNDITDHVKAQAPGALRYGWKACEMRALLVSMHGRGLASLAELEARGECVTSLVTSDSVKNYCITRFVPPLSEGTHAALVAVLRAKASEELLSRSRGGGKPDGARAFNGGHNWVKFLDDFIRRDDAAGAEVRTLWAGPYAYLACGKMKSLFSCVMTALKKLRGYDDQPLYAVPPRPPGRILRRRAAGAPYNV